MNLHGTNRFSRGEPASPVEIIIYFFFTIFASFHLIYGIASSARGEPVHPVKLEYFRKRNSLGLAKSTCKHNIGNVMN